MAVTAQILRTYRHPRRVMRGLMASSLRDDRPEARGLVYVMLGCLIIAISHVPTLISVEADLVGDAPLEARLGIAFFGWLFVAPLLLYGLAMLSHILARVVGGQGTGFAARLALFWTVLTVSPLFLVRALVTLANDATPVFAVEAAVALAFVVIWSACLIEAEAAPAGAES